MKLTIWAPELKDLPTVRLTLPKEFEAKDVQILYGYTQPRKPYDRTLFIQLVLPVHSTNRTLKSKAALLKKIVKKSWDKQNYEIVAVDEEFKSNQCFIYFQLKRSNKVMISDRLLSTPLKVEKIKEPRATPAKKRAGSRKKTGAKRSVKKPVRRKAARKSTTKKATRKKATRRKSVHKTPSKKRTAKKKVSKKRR